MFNNCSLLHSINISNFDTSNVTNIGNMFAGCSSLCSLNLSNFNTSFVTRMDSLFSNCSSLDSLNLSNFDISHVINMSYMFYNCSSLNSLYISHFDTSEVKGLDYIFAYCSKLEYINLENALLDKIILQYLEYSTIFKEISNNLILCSKENKWKIFLNGAEIINCDKYHNTINNTNFKCYSPNKSYEINNNNICQKCGENYYQIYESDVHLLFRKNFCRY